MKFKISELVDFNLESIKKDDELDEIHYLDTANLTEGVFEEIKKYNWKEDKVPSRARRRVKENDILVSTVRPNQKHYGFITAKEQEYIVSTGFAVVTPNTNKVDPYYLYQYLTLDETTNYLQMIAENSTSAYPSIKPKDIGDLEIELPTLNKQKQIGDFLWDINKKIHLNSSIISNLENLAQTLFKRWFVDFEFPNEDGKPYKSSGGKMIESELGMIPEGWEVEALGNITEIQNGYAFKSKDYVSEGVKVLRTLNIDEKGLLIKDNDLKYLPESFYQNDKFKKQRLQQYDTLLVMVGSTIGKLGIVLTSNLPSIQNQNMWRFRSKKAGVNDPYIYLLLQKLIEKMMGYKSGSAREFFRKDSFLKKEVVIPSIILSDNMKVFIDLFEQINQLHSENKSLNEIRDTLLPELLSGKIELPDDMEVTDDVPISRG